MYLLILIYNKVRLSLAAAVCLSCPCKNCSLIYQKSPTNFPLIKFLQGGKRSIYIYAFVQNLLRKNLEISLQARGNFLKKTNTKSGSESVLIIRYKLTSCGLESLRKLGYSWVTWAIFFVQLRKLIQQHTEKETIPGNSFSSNIEK